MFATGSPTQPDPIGLAGGLNLYGYAAGDPINGSDPFGLEVVFENDDDGKMKQAWNHAKRALRGAAWLGDGNAAFTLNALKSMEDDTTTTYTFVNDPSIRGAGNADGTTARINIGNIGAMRASGDILNVASTMVHEMGHLWYRRSWGGLATQEGSNFYAIGFDNAYRGAVRMDLRAGHHSYPRRK